MNRNKPIYKYWNNFFYQENYHSSCLKYISDEGTKSFSPVQISSHVESIIQIKKFQINNNWILIIIRDYNMYSNRRQKACLVEKGNVGERQNIMPLVEKQKKKQEHTRNTFWDINFETNGIKDISLNNINKYT